VIFAAGSNCNHHESCNGTMANALPICAIMNIDALQQCGGVGFDMKNDMAIGRCANQPANAPLVGTTLLDGVPADSQQLHCIKTTAAQAHCMTISHWQKTYNRSKAEVPEIVSCWTKEEVAAEPYGACCSKGSAAMITGDGAGSICCPWKIGQASDGSGLACCPEVDACNVCAGTAKQLDANGAVSATARYLHSSEDCCAVYGLVCLVFKYTHHRWDLLHIFL
jgi:hypothetical protein